MATLSMRQPSPVALLSLPNLQRRIMGSDEYGRFAAVVINPPELPVHASRPARGLPQQVLIVPL